MMTTETEDFIALVGDLLEEELDKLDDIFAKEENMNQNDIYWNVGKRWGLLVARDALYRAAVTFENHNGGQK